MSNKQEIRNLVWNMACSVSNGENLFSTWEYSQLRTKHNFYIAQYKSIPEGFLYMLPSDIQTMFVLFIYHSLS